MAITENSSSLNDFQIRNQEEGIEEHEKHTYEFQSHQETHIKNKKNRNSVPY